MKQPGISSSQNKLLMLFLLNTLGTRLSESQLLRIVSDNEWMNYFDFELTLHILADSHMVYQDQSINGVFYSITDIGRQTLEFFEKELPYSLRQTVREYCNQNIDELKLEARLFGEYLCISEDEYLVRLRILDKNATIFELNLMAASKEEAALYVENWPKRAQQLYKMSYEMLMK